MRSNNHMNHPMPPPAGGPRKDPAAVKGRCRVNLSWERWQAVPLPVPLPLPPGPSSAPSGSNALMISFPDLVRANRIGSGAGGTVYKVIHRPTGRVYALKVIYGNHDEGIRHHICREIQIPRDVDNPNVVKCYDMFDHLEFMDGGSLEGKHISNEKALSDLARQILTGLAYLHRRKIVHRNIKSSNLLINARNQVKIDDFGVSRNMAQSMDPCNSSVPYMSPERINTDLNQGKYDGYAGDIWSLGVSILEFYMGRSPFNARQDQGYWASLLSAICMSQPPEAPPTASREFRHFIACCLQREPNRRQSAAQLLQHPFISGNAGGGAEKVHHNLHTLS